MSNAYDIGHEDGERFEQHLLEQLQALARAAGVDIDVSGGSGGGYEGSGGSGPAGAGRAGGRRRQEEAPTERYDAHDQGTSAQVPSSTAQQQAQTADAQRAAQEEIDRTRAAPSAEPHDVQEQLPTKLTPEETSNETFEQMPGQSPEQMPTEEGGFRPRETPEQERVPIPTQRPAEANRPPYAGDGRSQPIEFGVAPGVNTSRGNPELIARLNAMHRAAPEGARQGFRVISGYRPATRAEARELGMSEHSSQEDIWERSNHGRKFRAAPPGQSRHQGGNAFDIQDPTGWYHKHARDYGIHFPVRGDYPHAQLDPSYKGKNLYDPSQGPYAPPAPRGESPPLSGSSKRLDDSRATPDKDNTLHGGASVYNPLAKGAGRIEGGPLTKSGERYNPNEYTAAIQKGHEKDVFGGNKMGYGKNYQPGYVLVEHPDGRKIITRINDIGPLKKGRVIDLNQAGMNHFDPSGKQGVIPGMKVTPLPFGKEYPTGPVKEPEKSADDEAQKFQNDKKDKSGPELGPGWRDEEGDYKSFHGIFGKVPTKISNFPQSGNIDDRRGDRTEKQIRARALKERAADSENASRLESNRKEAQGGQMAKDLGSKNLDEAAEKKSDKSNSEE